MSDAERFEKLRDAVVYLSGAMSAMVPRDNLSAKQCLDAATDCLRECDINLIEPRQPQEARDGE